MGLPPRKGKLQTAADGDELFSHHWNLEMFAADVVDDGLGSYAHTRDYMLFLYT
jgi:hypothetical protein